jgi:prepilin-type N-terminal cleavage/methylation domain-containing protein/prepilin-type processing-associated H-X9-DG protein
MKRSDVGFTLIEMLVVIAIIAILAAIIFPVMAAVRERARVGVCRSNMKQLGTAFLLYTDDWDEAYPLPYTDHMSGTASDHGRPTWKVRIWPYLRSKGIYNCPSNDSREHQKELHEHITDFYELDADTDYGMNGNEFYANWDGSEMLKPVTYTYDLLQPDHVILLLEVQNNDSQIRAVDIVLGASPDKVPEHFLGTLPPYGSPFFAHYSNGSSNWLFCDGSVRLMRVKDTLAPRNLWYNPDMKGEWGEFVRQYQADADREARVLPYPWR